MTLKFHSDPFACAPLYFSFFIHSVDSKCYMNLTQKLSHPIEASSPAIMVLLLPLPLLLLLFPNQAQHRAAFTQDQLQGDQARKILWGTYSSLAQANRAIMMLHYMKLPSWLVLGEEDQAKTLSTGLPPYPTPQHPVRQGSTVSWRPAQWVKQEYSLRRYPF